VKPLLMMRTRGLAGPLFAKHANSSRLSKSIGNAAGLSLLLGPELVTNGDFEDLDNGWTGLVVNNGIAKTVDTTGYQAISTVAGVEHELNFDCDNAGVAPLLAIQDGAVPPGVQIIGVDCSGGGAGFRHYSGRFKPLSADSVIVLSNGSNTAGWDNISVREVL